MTQRLRVKIVLQSMAMLLILGAALNACSGKLLLRAKSPCDGITCAFSHICDQGICVASATGPCSPNVPNGDCAAGEECINAACIGSDSAPEDCAPSHNGTCPINNACIEGACVPLETLVLCDADHIDGACQGGQVCVMGWCFADVDVACDGDTPTGYCADDKTCDFGTCSNLPITCSLDNPSGSCPAWQACVWGECVGPVPPDGCNPERQNGRCPADETCVSGTCTPLTEDNTCSVTNVNGLCPTGSACTDGRCVTITEENGCSPLHADGFCPSGAICQSGVCVQRPCNAGGMLCDDGEWCDSGTCRNLLCDSLHPVSECLDTSLVCVDGVCMSTPCSESVPDGPCPGDLVCREGDCGAPDCSIDAPHGYCEAGTICDTGVCVEGPCTPTNLDGTCEGYDVIFQPHTVEPVMVPLTCCDASRNSQISCELGECVGLACSEEQPYGVCDAGYYCNEGTCELAPCGPSFQNGVCDDGEVCDRGRCARNGCTGQGSDYCGEEVCDAETGLCVRAVCSVSAPHGICSLGQTCCSEELVVGYGCELGQCIYPECSVQFPGGSCDGDQICANGNCVQPACSIVHPDGSCGANYVCVEGACERAACSPLVPTGTCTSGERCVDGTCRIYACSEYFPSGPCTVGTRCQSGTCVTPTCSEEFPGGACAANQICSRGTCLSQPCSLSFPSGACGAGYSCNGGVCSPSVCSVDSPTGACVGENSGKVCHEGTCVVYECGTIFPTGPCATSGQICTDGVCSVPLCSSTYVGGRCENSHDICVSGSCQRLACSEFVQDGVCPSGQQCCDATLSTARGGCVQGTCVRANCSAEVHNGYCSGGLRCNDSGNCVANSCDNFSNGTCSNLLEICVENSCVRPACSLTYPNGVCEDEDKTCARGTCVVPACSVSVPNGLCPTGQVCSSGSCVKSPCSVLVQDGYCPAHQRCDEGTCRSDECSAYFPLDGTCSGSDAGKICVDGSCIVPACSTTYIGGACSDGKVCVGGTCILPACSASFTSGQCPGSQSCCSADMVTSEGCTLGTCVRDTCSPTSPNGLCTTGEVCCSPELEESAYCLDAEIGSCIPIACSPDFPYADCTGDNADKLCIDGACRDLCDDTHLLGWCPSGFACIAGNCASQCSDDDDCDTIANAHENSTACAAQHSSTDCVAVDYCVWRSDTSECLYDNDLDGAPDTLDRDSDGDLISDDIEAGDRNLATIPVDTDDDNTADFRDLDSDADHISDNFEAGAAPAVPQDSDGDGTSDFLDDDSDGDGIFDRCEVADGIAGLCSALGIIDIDEELSDVLDSDGDTLPDYRDTDSDDDGILDAIEARLKPRDVSTFSALGVDHDDADEGDDGNKLPDYRDDDSDDDGVADADEDVDGDGIVDCQLNGNGDTVADTRASPECNATIVIASGYFAPGYAYDYNPGCYESSQKCLLAESSRVHPDSDGDGINDSGDGGFLVCSSANLKPVNLFFSRSADYALALEQSFDQSRNLSISGNQVGLTFQRSSSDDGAYAVGGFIVKHTPGATAMATTDADPNRVLIEKALVQEELDRTAMSGASGVTSITLVINRNFVSFDGYGVVVSRSKIITSSSISLARLRDRLAAQLDGSVTGYANSDAGPSSTDFTLVTETVYRYDNGSTGVVMTLGALVPTSSPATQSYEYRTSCSSRTVDTCAAAGLGCSVVSGVCEETSSYQIPLFYVDNVTSGSALAQYGDGVADLCQSLVQQNSPLDFLWIVDNSNSMDQEINQVLTSAKLFFGLLNNSEADYRVAQTTSSENRSNWEPTYDFSAPTTDEANRRNGMLIGGFTGAVAGVATATTDRAVQYDCAGNPTNCQTNACGGANCCPACTGSPGAVINDPSCYFSSRLPCATGGGQEFVMNMGQWAIYRNGADVACQGVLSEGDCTDLPGCIWSSGACIAGYCELSGGDNSIEQCNGNDPSGTGQRPFGTDTAEDELEPAGCEWNGQESACWPSIGAACSNNTTSGSCPAPRCQWTGTLCVPNMTYNRTFCSSQTQTQCTALAGGWCTWNALTSTCETPPRYGFRSGASRIAVVLSDEEDCYNKDHDFDGDCEWPGAYGGNINLYNAPTRVARTNAYKKFYQSHGFMVFAITGDKANASLSPSISNGGCSVGSTKSAEAGQTYINVAEGTGGGWGSICATNLYPTIESVIIGSLGYASPYVLEGFIGGHAVQPIASTIKVAVQVCSIPSEYPTCDSGTTMRVVNRSRSDGFDYDANYNALVLYGSARPAANRDIVVSYRYWIDNPQSAAGNSACPCPAASGDDCSCPAGTTCGMVGSTDNCAVKSDESDCNSAPGCAWNTANGGACAVTGLCEADPTCGGSCGTGEVCNSTTGLCICDISCGGGCSAGSECDHDLNSGTCGLCQCDTTCQGGCATGRICNNSEASPYCGLCECDTGCGSGCTAGQICDNDPDSGTCGFCKPPECPVCDAGEICDYASGECVCDPSCDGGCPLGQTCNTDEDSLACGTCECDPTCGGGCQAGQVCQDDLGSPQCGLCILDATCGGGCNPSCEDAASESACALIPECMWAAWQNSGAGGCRPITCHSCNPLGLCVTDTTCCGGCDPVSEVCNENTGQCECDATCDSNDDDLSDCIEGTVCSGDPSAAACGSCVCDTTCGGCPTGQLCNSDRDDSTDDANRTCGICYVDTSCGSACESPCTDVLTEIACAAIDECRWAEWDNGGLGACQPLTWVECNTASGLCRIDEDCSNDCAANEYCNGASGECVCDLSCGGGCSAGKICDADPDSDTCGTCVCDPDCGGTCPTGQVCDSTEGLTCGLCLPDPTCGGSCGVNCSAPTTQENCELISGCRWAPSEGDLAAECQPVQWLECNPLRGLCQVDTDCGDACRSSELCNAANGQCECNATCGYSCAPGLACDTSLTSPTCGQCRCDTSCGGDCPIGLACDDNTACIDAPDQSACSAISGCGWDPVTLTCNSVTCGACVVDTNCGGLCGEGEVCNPTTGLCEINCPDECPDGQICDDLTGVCACDTSCGESCPAGAICDDDLDSDTCGLCVCDTTCGGSCPACQICDDEQGSATCGMCVVDTTCGGGCGFGQVCDNLSGCCVTDPNCGGLCPVNFRCDPLTWRCLPEGG